MDTEYRAAPEDEFVLSFDFPCFFRLARHLQPED